MLWELASNDSRECPRLDGVSGRKRIATLEEGDACSLRLWSRSLGDRFQDVNRNFRICEGFDADSCCITSPWIAVSFAVKIEGSGKWIDRIVRPSSGGPLT